MKICILKRDGDSIHEGMVTVLSVLVEEHFGKKDLFIEKTEKEFTEMVTFEVPESVDYADIVEFIAEVSKVNSLYAVRII